MSVLSQDHIRRLAKNPHRILGDQICEANFQSCSYDLRIGTIYIEDHIINSENQNNQPVLLASSQIVNLLTLEEVNLPSNLCATVFAINGNSSKGLLILNPGHIDPGYKGPLSICAINLSDRTIPLSIGDKIFTIFFQEVKGNTAGYSRNSMLPRSEFEKHYFDNTALRLSNSLFDLMKVDKYKPHLVGLIKEILKDQRQKLYSKLIRWLVIIVTIVGTVLGAALAARELFFKDTIELKEQIEENETLIDQQELLIKRQEGTIDSLKSKLDE